MSKQVDRNAVAASLCEARDRLRLLGRSHAAHPPSLLFGVASRAAATGLVALLGLFFVAADWKTAGTGDTNFPGRPRPPGFKTECGISECFDADGNSSAKS